MDFTPYTNASFIIAGLALVTLVVLAVRSNRKTQGSRIILLSGVLLTFAGLGASLNTLAPLFA